MFVRDLLHPGDDDFVELLLDGDVTHGGHGGGAVPVLFARCKPDHVGGPDLLDRAAVALDATAAGGHDQGLAQRMSVPDDPGSKVTSAPPVNQSNGPIAEGRLPARMMSMVASHDFCRSMM